MIVSQTDQLLEAVAELRTLFPDWRLGQLVANLVTAAAWPAHPQWLRRFLEVLGTRVEP